MSAMLERLERVEQEVSRLSERLALLEGPAEAPAAKAELARSVPSVPRATALPAPRPLPPARPAVRALDLEELLGGRLFALAGGAAVIVGVAFFVALAVERGWIGETLRTLLAFAGSSALLAAGVWLHERRGGTQASLAAVGTGMAALYLTLTGATTLCDEGFPRCRARQPFASSSARRCRSRRLRRRRRPRARARPESGPGDREPI